MKIYKIIFLIFISSNILNSNLKTKVQLIPIHGVENIETIGAIAFKSPIRIAPKAKNSVMNKLTTLPFFPVKIFLSVLFFKIKSSDKAVSVLGAVKNEPTVEEKIAPSKPGRITIKP